MSLARTSYLCSAFLPLLSLANREDPRGRYREVAAAPEATEIPSEIDIRGLGQDLYVQSR